jgi:DNA-directed RNA polymerase specialized sigma24 family protein
MTTRLPTTGLFRFQVFLTVTRPSAPGARAPTAAARAADEALAALYAEHARSLLRMAALLIWAGGIMAVPDTVRGMAEEIVHEAFAAMHREWRRLRDADRALRYLRRAIVNRTRACVRASHGDLTSDGSLLAALRRMPGRQREALVLRYYADLPEAQAAAAMGVSTAAFRGHAARGIRALRSEAYAPAPHPQGLSTPHPRLVCLTHNAVHSMSSCCAQRYPQAR